MLHSMKWSIDGLLLLMLFLYDWNLVSLTSYIIANFLNLIVNLALFIVAFVAVAITSLYADIQSWRLNCKQLYYNHYWQYMYYLIKYQAGNQLT